MIRNRISALRAGGPRQYSQMSDRIAIKVRERDRDTVFDRLDEVGLEVSELGRTDWDYAEPRDAIERVSDRIGEFDLQDNIVTDEFGELEQDIIDVASPAIGAAQTVAQYVITITGVLNASFMHTYADFGPENLRLSPVEMGDISMGRARDTNRNMEDVNESVNIEEAWEETRGENAIVAVFDTAYAEGIVSEDRVVGTWHGEDVDSVYEPSEGHGTMCAGAAVANYNDNGNVPYNGTAPDADVILVRITDDQGQIRQDYILDAWDWIADFSTDKPIVSNHSYGTPLCSGRPRQRHCEGPDIDMIKEVGADKFHTPVYAAGNEADRCGRRPIGATNAITGTNSISEVITVGALRFDMRDAQRYTSHGRGDCAPVADPKPNVSFMLPHKTYYSDEDGIKIKDMSQGVGGSAGGTSHAAPSVSGIIALMQSKAMDEYGEPLQTEEVKSILHEVSEPPRPTQINALPGFTAPAGWDARFGYGQPDPVEALKEV